MQADRGYTLVEIVVAVGIIALVAAGGMGLTLASRSMAVAAAAAEFDSLVDAARTVARDVEGGVLQFTTDGDGTTVTLYGHALDGTLIRTALPALHTKAHIAENDALGDPAFALVLHADGRLGGIPHAASAEVGCPAGGRFHFVISAAGGSADRYLPCRTSLATGGTLAFTTLPPAVPGASPTPCADACAQPTFPAAPTPTATCPSGYTPSGTTCIPTATSTPTPDPAASATPTSTATPIATPTVTATPTATATPASTCDLVQSGTCYHRIMGPMIQIFDKTVSPGYTCDSSGACQWINSVGRVTISAREAYGLQPPVAPSDIAHQLLFVVDGVATVGELCSSYQTIIDRAAPPPSDISWNGLVSGPTYGNLLILGSAPGYGQPAIYAYRHNVVQGSAPAIGLISQSDFDATQYSQTIDEFAYAVKQPIYGPIVSWTYSDPTIVQGKYVIYVPDFTDCASALPDDRILDDQLYGITTASIVLEAYQAIPQ